MRVMLFSDTYAPHVNGVATSVHTLARALNAAGHEVMVYSVSTGEAEDQTPDDPFPVMRVAGMRLPIYGDYRLAPPVVPRFDQVMRRFAPDVLHIHTPLGIGWRAVAANRTARFPLIGTHHTLFGAYIEAYARLGARLNGQLAGWARRYSATFYNQCDLVSCASRFLADELRAGGLKRPIQLVPNPLNTARFYPITRPLAAQTAGNEQRLIYFGRLAPEKNLHRLLLLVEPTLRRHPNVVLEIVGEGAVKQSLMDLAQQRQLEQQVRFVGYLHGEALARRVAGSRLFVTTSLTENQPMTVLESLACGVPVVALAAAGVPEIVTDQENGFLVAPDDNSGLFSERIEQLLGDDGLRAQMSQQAMRSAQRFTQAAVLQATLESYQKTIEQAARRQQGTRPRRSGPLAGYRKRLVVSAGSLRALGSRAPRKVADMGRLVYNGGKTRHETTPRGD
jgi:glycosyltransferase involved in cell wall biosynthesis